MQGGSPASLVPSRNKTSWTRSHASCRAEASRSAAWGRVWKKRGANCSLALTRPHSTILTALAMRTRDVGGCLAKRPGKTKLTTRLKGVTWAAVSVYHICFGRIPWGRVELALS
jgi:hypothetical protein